MPTARGLAAVIAALACTALPALAEVKVMKVEERIASVPARTAPSVSLKRVQLTLNKSEVVEVAEAVADALVGAPDIADVLPVTDRAFYMLGKKVGTTNVTLFDREKRLVSIIDIVVRPDLAEAQSDVRGSSGEPRLRLSSQGDRTVLTGTARDAVTVDRAMHAAPPGTVNMTQVASPQQVSLKVRIVEVNRGALREFGTRWDMFNRNQTGKPASQIGVGTTTTSLDDGVLSRTATQAIKSTPFATILSTFGGAGRGLDIQIDALEQKGLVRRLAEPNLVALSGGQAEFQAGGQIPIPTPQASGGVAGGSVITVVYKDFGVRLKFSPTVLTNGLIHLALEPEVSDIDPSLSVGLGAGITVPGLTTRRARTEIQLRDGQSFAIAGLLQTIAERNIDQLPWLGSIPVLGALFSSKQFKERETELVVIVTPSLVRPAKPGQLLATPLDTSMPPNDLDFFASNKLELRRNMREFVTKEGAAVGPHGHLLPAMLGDPMAAPAVCATARCTPGP